MPQLSRQRAKEKFYEVVAEQLGSSARAELADETTWDALGADSLDAIEIIMSLEEEFEIEIPGNEEDALGEIFKAGTVGKAWEWIATRPELATSFTEETRP